MPPAERSISNFFGIFPVQQKLSNKIGGIYISTSGMPVVKFSQKSGIKTISDKSAPIGLEAIAAFYGISRLIIEFKE
jgi:hypothetical protein